METAHNWGRAGRLALFLGLLDSHVWRLSSCLHLLLVPAPHLPTSATGLAMLPPTQTGTFGASGDFLFPPTLSHLGALFRHPNL